MTIPVRVAGLVNRLRCIAGGGKIPANANEPLCCICRCRRSIDPLPITNIFTSYYVYGGATALALDLRLRSDFNLTLDDYMRQVWLAYGKTGKPYTIPDLQAVLAKVTNPKFAASFFTDYIYGVKKNNYEALLANAGLLLQKAQPGKGWLGRIATKVGNVGLVVTGSTTSNTPIYKAGIDAGDIILTIDGQEAKTTSVFTDAVKDKKPGDKVAVTYKNRSGNHEGTIVLEESPALEVVTFEKAGKDLTQQQKDFRSSWLSSKVK
jgi:predicted metalloprotease with PDZ domain